MRKREDWFRKNISYLSRFGIRYRDVFVNVWMWRLSLRRRGIVTSRSWGSELTHVHGDISKSKAKPEAICYLQIYRSRSQSPRPYVTYKYIEVESKAWGHIFPTGVRRGRKSEWNLPEQNDVHDHIFIIVVFVTIAQSYGEMDSVFPIGSLYEMDHSTRDSQCPLPHPNKNPSALGYPIGPLFSSLLLFSSIFSCIRKVLHH